MKIINIAHKIAARLMRKTQSCLGLITLGPRAIILNDNNQVLLVKHTYQENWYLPGGGLKKGETIKKGLLRELKEEIGLTTLEEPQLFGIYFNTQLEALDYPIIYIIKKYTLDKLSYSREIEKMAWFDYAHLPESISPGTKRRLDEYFNESLKSETW